MGPRTCPPLSLLSRILSPASLSRIDCFALVQLYMKTVKTEAFFNFKFGTGRDKNLVINLTEFVDSKVYAGSSSSDSNSTNGTT